MAHFELSTGVLKVGIQVPTAIAAMTEEQRAAWDRAIDAAKDIFEVFQ